MTRATGAAVLVACASIACRSAPPTAGDRTQTERRGASATPPPASDDGTGAPAAKRAGPPDVPPVTVGAIRYTVVPWGKQRGLGQNGGIIAATRASDGAELWTLKVYDVSYDAKLEEDVQDVFIETLTAGPGADELTVVDERGGEYRIDTTNRRVRVIKPRP